MKSAIYYENAKYACKKRIEIDKIDIQGLPLFQLYVVFVALIQKVIPGVKYLLIGCKIADCKASRYRIITQF